MAYHVTATQKQLCFAFRRVDRRILPLWRRWASAALIFVLLSVSLSGPALAALARVFPSQAQSAEMTLSAARYPQVLINGKTRTLSAAAKIRNADNLIVMPSSLGDGAFVVKYTDNALGEIDRVWLLSAFEARQMGPLK